MGAVKEFFDSIFSNAKARINDPFIGTFIISWVLWNWNHIALVVWGEDKLSNRVSFFHNYLSTGNWLEFNTLLLIPLVSTLIYIIVVPWVKWIFNGIQVYADNKLHEQAVNNDLNKINAQEELNKARLKANPSKKFLEQSVQLDMDKEAAVYEELREKNIIMAAKSREAVAKADEATALARSAQASEETHRKKEELAQLEAENSIALQESKKIQFQIEADRNKATLASHRFPSAFNFIHLMSESLNEDDIAVSVYSLGRIVSFIFGYQDFYRLINDDVFNNDTLSELKFIVYDEGELAVLLNEIEAEGKAACPDITSDKIFDHIQSIFDNLPYKFVTSSEIEEMCLNYLEENKYEVLEYEAVVNEMAISDTIYEDVDIDGVENISFVDGIDCKISAQASGNHRREADIPGVDMDLEIHVTAERIVGRNGYGELSIKADATLQYD